MGKVYNTQDFLYIKAEYYNAFISDQLASAVIKYVDPDGYEGQWAPCDIDAVNKQIIYTNPIGNKLKKGKWKAWSFATATDGRVIPGEPDTFIIKQEGTN